MSGSLDYILGHADPEFDRLQLQAPIIAGVTSRLIRESGIKPGMKVLDIGCGAGDVAILLADAVGETGSVLAFDREQRAVEAARSRARATGYRQIEFFVASDDALPSNQEFDAAIGRYVLVHQSDPVAMIRRAASAVRSGGIVAFHEPAAHIGGLSLPAVELWNGTMACYRAAFRALLPQHDVGGRLVKCFEDAGLSDPHLIWESIAGGCASALPQWMAATYRAMLPHIERLEIAHDGIGDPDTLADRIKSEVASLKAQLVSTPQSCAWAVRS